MSVGNHIVEHLSMGLPESLDAMSSSVSGAANPLHQFVWKDTSGQGHGSHAIKPRYGGFTVTGFTQTGDTNTSTLITNLDDSMRPRPGMTVAGSGVPGGATVISVDRSANSMVISTPTISSLVGTTLTFAGTSYDPVISFGYNQDAGGSEVVQYEGQAFIQFEGHFHRESDDVALMETFFAFDIDGSSGQARPAFTSYDKVLKKTLDFDVSPGVDQIFNVYFQNYTGGAGGSPSYTFQEGNFKIIAPPLKTSLDVSFDVGSHVGQSSFFKMSANGDDGAVKPSVKFICGSAGGTSQHRVFSLTMSDDTAAKSGVASFRADSDISGANTVMFAVGQAAGSSQALVHFSSENFTTTLPTFKATSKASQARALLELDGVNNTISTVEARKAQLYPKGYWAYRESGNTSTDREPSTGVNTVSLDLTNCPGTGTTTKWMPILDTAGVLHWMPAVSDA